MNTDSNSAVRSPHPAEGGPRGAIRVPTRARDGADRPWTTAATEGEHRPGLWGRLVAGLTPPEPWTHRPASLAAMSRYARQGGWAGPAGPARAAGVWWFRLVAVPVCLVTHYLAWLVARPSRALTVALVGLLVWLAVTR